MRITSSAVASPKSVIALVMRHPFQWHYNFGLGKGARHNNKVDRLGGLVAAPRGGRFSPEPNCFVAGGALCAHIWLDLFGRTLGDLASSQSGASSRTWALVRFEALVTAPHAALRDGLAALGLNADTYPYARATATGAPARQRRALLEYHTADTPGSATVTVDSRYLWSVTSLAPEQARSVAHCHAEEGAEESACCQLVTLAKSVFGYDLVAFDKSHLAEAVPFSSAPAHGAKLEHALAALGRAGLSDEQFFFSTSDKHAACFSAIARDALGAGSGLTADDVSDSGHRRGRKGRGRRGRGSSTVEANEFEDREMLPSASTHIATSVEQTQVVFAAEMSSAETSSPLVRTKRPVFFMHLHKAAGTTLCLLALSNGHRAAGMKQDERDPKTKLKYGFNCNILGDDPGHLGLGVANQESTFGQAEGRMTCKQRGGLMNERKWTFSAIERWIYPQEICPDQFIYITCLRDPVSRIKSSVKFHVRQTEDMVVSWATKHEFNAAAPISTGSPSVDNFYTRSFAGKITYLKPLGSVNDLDLAVAKATIDRFEAVLILEHFDRDLVQLEKLLGWNTKNLGQAKKSSSDKKKVAFSPAQEALLKQRNALDFEFYAHAEGLAEKISIRARANIG